MDPLRFRNRAHAGQRLAAMLAGYSRDRSVLVLGLPRGGVPVAFEVARALSAEMDVFLVRKLGLPGHEELAMGAIASGGIRVLNEDILSTMRVPPSVVDSVTEREMRELERRAREYRGARPAPLLRGRTVMLVDDGLATGSTMRAAVAAARKEAPRRLVVAVPLAAAETCAALRDEVDEVFCASTPEPFHAVGLWYDEFPQTRDEEVRDLLAEAQRSAEQAVRLPQRPT